MTATPTQPSDDIYADWRTDIERISGDDNCPKCYGRGWLGLTKSPVGRTMLAACRCAKIAQYPVHELLRGMVREEVAVIHQSLLGLKAQNTNEHDTMMRRQNVLLGEILTPFWKKIFRGGA